MMQWAEDPSVVIVVVVVSGGGGAGDEKMEGMIFIICLILFLEVNIMQTSYSFSTPTWHK